MRLTPTVPGITTAILGLGGSLLADAHTDGLYRWLSLALTVTNVVVLALFAVLVFRHRGVPPNLRRVFYNDPPGWRIVSVGRPDRRAQFEVVRVDGDQR